VAPPPAPPTFQAKLAVIQQNHGAPVAAAQAARISVENRGRPQAITNVRPVTAEAGKVTLAPRAGAAGAQARKVEPVTAGPVRGRAVATTSQPVSAAPVTSNVRGGTGGAGTGQTPQTIERGSVPQGNVPRGNFPSGQAGQSQTLERKVVSPAPVINEGARGRQTEVESRQIHPTAVPPGGGPPPRPTTRTLERQENVVPRNEGVYRPTPSRPTPSNGRGNQTMHEAHEAQPQTHERIERPTPAPPPHSNVSGEATSSGRQRVVTPEPQGHPQNESRGRSQVVSPPPHNPEAGGQQGNQKKKEEKPKPEKPNPEKTPKS
jgi:hypothetical protein